MKKWFLFIGLTILFIFCDNIYGQDVIEKGTYSFKKKKRKLAFKNWNNLKKKSVTSAHIQKGKTKKGTYSFSKRKKRVRRSNGFFSHSKRKSYIGPGLSKGKSSSNFSKRKFKRNGILSFLPNGKRNRKYHNTGFKSNSTFHYNRKQRRVTPNKTRFLIFFKKKRKEKYTDTFSGGQVKNFLSFNKYSSRKRKSVHPFHLFKRKNKNAKKKRLEMNLFSPRMRTH
jgi:hypothetical protein